METIAIFEAKSRLSEILAAVEHGEEFTVTKRGEPIALIVPYHQKERSEAASQLRRALIVRCREARKATPVEGVDLRAALEEGRD
ncbi:MAG: hypothetical protein A3H93_08450 [Rhodocyclales bacterium RIFCSPLOWO2_02_FULL_63_24]|nr:MAG: hypothetical protein A2040_01440 [Rhodocyclales bacterium GWA2_65_19]OHC72186.1 MAG: hypothetical protein A3H93_08450 [Rhodocyclales bacterium RIFCSPLOWO2_02_FULL_63_24]